MQTIDLYIHTSFDEARADWKQVGTNGTGAAYQKYRWCKTWFDAKGKALGYTPAIAIGYQSGQPVFVLPFQRSNSASVARLSFMGEANSNQNTGLWIPGFARTATNAAMTDVLMEICRTTRSDILELKSVAPDCGGHTVPLLIGPEPASPSPLFRGEVTATFSDFLKTAKSSSTRAKLRRKQKHLAAAGSYRVFKASQGGGVDRILACFFEHRAARAREAGVPNAFADENTQAFLKNLMNPKHDTSAEPDLHVWALEAGGDIRAVFLCLEEEHTWTAYANSFANDELALHSPAIILLMEILEAACSDPAVRVFDFGLGDEAYKHGWTGPVQLYDRLIAATAKGHAAKAVIGGRQRLKAGIRGSDKAWRAVRSIRRLTARLK